MMLFFFSHVFLLKKPAETRFYMVSLYSSIQVITSKVLLAAMLASTTEDLRQQQGSGIVIVGHQKLITTIQQEIAFHMQGLILTIDCKGTGLSTLVYCLNSPHRVVINKQIHLASFFVFCFLFCICWYEINKI